MNALALAFALASLQEHAPQEEAPSAPKEALPAVAEADPAALQKIRALGGVAVPVAADTHFLTLHLGAAGAKLEDATLEALKGIAEQVLWLNLAGTAVGDAGLRHLEPLKNLRQLHLERTGVGDAGLESLRVLGELRYLNLYGTRITDKGLAALAGLKKLKSLYVWQTAVTEAGAAELARAIPGLVVTRGVEPPPAGAETPAPPKEEAQLNELCPVTGDAAGGPTLLYKGQVIGLCCERCRISFEKDPSQYIGKVKGFKDPDKK